MWKSSISGMNENIYLKPHPFGRWADSYKAFSGKYIFGGYTFNPDTNSVSIDLPNLYHQEVSEEGIPEMKLEEYEEYRDDKSRNRRYVVACHCESDLSQEHILKSISIMKSKLMMQCAPYRVENIKCEMTPAVKANMINAYRRVNMFGKKTPFVACFDEYGRRLPDEVKIDTIRGMDIKIVDPVENGGSYLVFEAVVSDRNYDRPLYTDPYDLPF